MNTIHIHKGVGLVGDYLVETLCNPGVILDEQFDTPHGVEETKKHIAWSNRSCAGDYRICPDCEAAAS